MPSIKKNLTWEDLQALGNPENAPDLPQHVVMVNYADFDIKVHYEKKGRGGKEAIIIKGINQSDDVLKDLCKLIKGQIGVGGSAKDGEIILQGSQRDKVIQILKDQGYKNIKKAGG